MSILDKFLNIGKKDKFFLELKDDDNGIIDKVEAVATKVKEEAQQVVEEVKQTFEDSSTAEEVKSTAKEVKSETKQVAKEVKTQIKTKVDGEAKSQTASSPEQNGKSASKTEANAPSQQAPASIDMSYSEEPFWVKLMYKTTEQKAAEESSEKTFATDYLISQPKPRRRPGGSLDKFKSMARETKNKF